MARKTCVFFFFPGVTEGNFYERERRRYQNWDRRLTYSLEKPTNNGKPVDVRILIRRTLCKSRSTVASVAQGDTHASASIKGHGIVAVAGCRRLEIV